MELAISIAAVVVSALSVVVNLRRAVKSRHEELRLLCSTAVDCGLASRQPGIPLVQTCLEAGILADLRDGKRDFSNDQIHTGVVAVARRM